MGLDISAYEHVTLIRPLTVEQANAEDYEPWGKPEVFLYVDAPNRTQHDGMISGVYATSGKTRGFRAGSYGGYNAYRRMLASLVGTTPERIWTDPSGGPFVEQINFSDCEGLVGPKTSAKLAADYNNWSRQALKFVRNHKNGGEFLELYNKWQLVFELASKDGAVLFH